MTAATATMPTEVTPTELALLVLSNPPELSLDARVALAVTTKDSYVWAVFLAGLAESDLVVQPAQLVDTIYEEIKREQIEEMLPSAGVRGRNLPRSILERVAGRLLSPRPSNLDEWFEGLLQNADR